MYIDRMRMVYRVCIFDALVEELIEMLLIGFGIL